MKSPKEVYELYKQIEETASLTKNVNSLLSKLLVRMIAPDLEFKKYKKASHYFMDMLIDNGFYEESDSSVLNFFKKFVDKPILNSTVNCTTIQDPSILIIALVGDLTEFIETTWKNENKSTVFIDPPPAMAWLQPLGETCGDMPKSVCILYIDSTRTIADDYRYSIGHELSHIVIYHALRQGLLNIEMIGNEEELEFICDLAALKALYANSTNHHWSTKFYNKIPCFKDSVQEAYTDLIDYFNEQEKKEFNLVVF